MRDRNRGIRIKQQLRHRLADDVRAPDHDRFKAGKIAQPVGQQHDAAERCARHEAALPDREATRVRDMEAIDILVRD